MRELIFFPLTIVSLAVIKHTFVKNSIWSSAAYFANGFQRLCLASFFPLLRFLGCGSSAITWPCLSLSSKNQSSTFCFLTQYSFRFCKNTFNSKKKKGQWMKFKCALCTNYINLWQSFLWVQHDHAALPFQNIRLFSLHLYQNVRELSTTTQLQQPLLYKISFCQFVFNKLYCYNFIPFIIGCFYVCTYTTIINILSSQFT